MGKFTGLNNFSTKFKLQLILSFVSTCVIILVVACVFFYFRSVTLIKQKSQDDILQQLQQLEHNLNIFMTEAEYMSQSLILTETPGRLLNGSYKNDQEKVALANDIFVNVQKILLSYEYVDSVYYYGSDGMVMGSGRSFHRFIENGIDKDPFYKSDIYKESLEGDKSHLWSGDYLASSYGFVNKEDAIPYISLLRKINFNGSQKAILVININEEFFRKLYYSESTKNYFDRYIVDQNGKTISHHDREKLNSIKPYTINLEQDAQGSMETLANGERIQVVHYQMKDKNWTIVDETPIRYLEKDANSLKSFMYLIILISAAVALLTSIFWIYRITKPLSKLNKIMKETEKGKLGLELDLHTTKQLGVLGRQFNKMSISVETLLESNRLIEEEKRAYEIETLWSQMNPHFIYNTLNTVKWMSIIAKTENITKCIHAMGNLLHPIFRRSGDFCTLSEEINYVQDYIVIMNYRYGNTIKLKIDIEEELRELQIVRLTLQPLVENCIGHGKSSANETLEIQLHARVENNVLKIFVIDNGSGIDEKRLLEIRKSLLLAHGKSLKEREKPSAKRKGIGIANVNRRIQLCHGKDYVLEIESQVNRGTTVKIRLPLLETII